MTWLLVILAAFTVSALFAAAVLAHYAWCVWCEQRAARRDARRLLTLAELNTAWHLPVREPGVGGRW